MRRWLTRMELRCLAASAFVLAVAVAILVTHGQPGVDDVPGSEVGSAASGQTDLRAVAVLGVDAEKAATAAPASVGVGDFVFAPGHLVVATGTIVTWKVSGQAPHSITADDGSFHSGTVGPGDSFTHRFESEGTFTYICAFHPQMLGVVEVEDAPPTARDSELDDDGAASLEGGEAAGSAGGPFLSAYATESHSSFPEELLHALLVSHFIGAVAFDVWRHRRGATT